MVNFQKIINETAMLEKDKEGYCWLMANFTEIQRIVKNTKNIGETRKKIFREIGFAPSIIMSFKHLFESEKIYLEALEKNYYLKI